MSNISRRLFLRSTPAAGVALALPAQAASSHKPQLSQDERLASALNEVVTVYRERYPNCPIRIQDTDIGDKGMLLILTHIADDAPGTVTYLKDGVRSKHVRVIVDDGSPLLPDDVTGSTAYADWEAGRSR